MKLDAVAMREGANFGGVRVTGRVEALREVADDGFEAGVGRNGVVGWKAAFRDNFGCFV